MKELPPHLLFYDGVCAMCNGIVKAMLRVDQEQVFHFAPLQGETAELAREIHREFPTEIETLVYAITRGRPVHATDALSGQGAVVVPVPAGVVHRLLLRDHRPDQIPRLWEVRSLPAASGRGEIPFSPVVAVRNSM